MILYITILYTRGRFGTHCTYIYKIHLHRPSNRLFARGVVKCSNHVPLYQAWACLEMRSENFAKAKKLISEGLTKDKTQGSGWLVAAQIEERLGNEGLVERILKRGLKCAPYSAELYCTLAEFNIQRGKIQIVRKTLLGLK